MVFLCKYSHALSEDLLGDDPLDGAEAAGPGEDLHAQGLAHQLQDGTQLPHVEVDGHQQQQCPEVGGPHPQGPGGGRQGTAKRKPLQLASYSINH